MFRFVIRGARGGTPVCGPDFAKFGGSTTCFTVETPDGILVLDAGTGLANLNDEIESRTALPPFTFLFTHLHLDHLIGLPFFAPIYQSGTSLTLMGDPHRDDDWKTVLTTLVGKPYWPISLRETSADVTLQDLPSERGPIDLYGCTVSWCPVWHPQQSLAYKIRMNGTSIVVATDHEPGHEELEPILLEFCKNADFLIYDAEFHPNEYAQFRGWGHGTWKDAAETARACGVGKLILTHHHRARRDVEISRMVELARSVFPETIAAAENLALT